MNKPSLALEGWGWIRPVDSEEFHLFQFGTIGAICGNWLGPYGGGGGENLGDPYAEALLSIEWDQACEECRGIFLTMVCDADERRKSERPQREVNHVGSA